MTKRTLLRRVSSIPILGRVAMMGFRAFGASPPIIRNLGRFGHWLVASREYTNYTYDLSPLNVNHLAAFTAHIAGTTFDQAMSYISELEADERLKQHVRRYTNESPDRAFADNTARYGRRLGWYGLVRMLRPRIVIETGVDKGIGACVLCAALLRNAEDGFPGKYLGTDINSAAGYLLSDRYATVGTILYGDSIESLRQINEPVDLFINDSDHSSEYERREYQEIESMLSDRAVILGDNAHETNELLEWAQRSGREFLFFQEQPANHWHPGAGIGAAWIADSSSTTRDATDISSI